MTELRRINTENDITAELIKYIIGSNGKDYYKLIHNNNHTTTVIPFNFLFAYLSVHHAQGLPDQRQSVCDKGCGVGAIAVGLPTPRLAEEQQKMSRLITRPIKQQQY
jgi:hypothetical protein